MVKGSIFTDYYRGCILSTSKSRYDIDLSTQSYPLFEGLLINKIKFNVGGLSFNYSPRPQKFKANKERLAEMIIGKGSSNISSVFIPNITKSYIGYGDINTTNDAVIILFDEDKKIIELFIARGLKYDKRNLYNEVIEGYLNNELEAIRQRSVNVFKN
jgi:hypothetical protein